MADLVLSATPIDLTRVLHLNKPVVRVRYELDELAPEASRSDQVAHPSLADLLAPIVERARANSSAGTAH
jgi:hypothetical protein